VRNSKKSNLAAPAMSQYEGKKEYLI
jgi:hypothetical protein